MAAGRGFFRSALERVLPASASAHGLANHGANDELYFGEQVKALRANFEQKAEETGMKVAAVTSSVAGEGKSLITLRLADVLANVAHRRVLLLGLDLRKGDSAGRLGPAGGPGMAEFLTGGATTEEVIRQAPGKLHVVPPGKPVKDPVPLLSGERFRSFLGEMRNRYQYILLDTPPVLPVSDTLALRPCVDGFFVVFRIGYTPVDMFRQGIELVGEEHVRGVILNGVETPVRRYYGKYYGPYYYPAGKR